MIQDQYTTDALEPTKRDEILDGLFAASAEAWPAVQIPRAAFAAYVLERLPDGEEPATALGRLHGTDLYLACGCSAGDPRALEELERRLMPEVTQFLNRGDSFPGFAEEVKQVLRERVLVGRPGQPPRIGGYSGRGPLLAWLRTAAARAAVDLRRSAGARESTVGDALTVLSTASDPELAYLKSHYEKELGAAIGATLATLTTREKNALALFFLDQVGAEAIGSMYRVSGRTVRRWIEDARQKVLDETMRLLVDRLQLPRAEIIGLLKLVESQLDLSISRILRREP